MDAVSKSRKEILEDMTAFALSSDTLRARARALDIGAFLSFVPSQLPDGGFAQRALARRLSSAFRVTRIDFESLPGEYAWGPDDLPARSLLFLVSAEAEPEMVQLAAIDGESGGGA